MQAIGEMKVAQCQLHHCSTSTEQAMLLYFLVSTALLVANICYYLTKTNDLFCVASLLWLLYLAINTLASKESLRGLK